MWVFTKDGFFSVVQKPGQGSDFITIRARCEKDIKNLAAMMGLSQSSIRDKAGTDYEYRVETTKEKWGRYLTLCAQDIDYSNFKHEVTEAEPERGRVYMDVWLSLLNLAARKIQSVFPPVRDYGEGHFDDGGVWRDAEELTTPKKKKRRKRKRRPKSSF